MQYHRLTIEPPNHYQAHYHVTCSYEVDGKADLNQSARDVMEAKAIAYEHLAQLCREARKIAGVLTVDLDLNPKE